MSCLNQSQMIKPANDNVIHMLKEVQRAVHNHTKVSDYFHWSDLRAQKLIGDSSCPRRRTVAQRINCDFVGLTRIHSAISSRQANRQLSEDADASGVLITRVCVICTTVSFLVLIA